MSERDLKKRYKHVMVGGVAQWLECLYLAGGLSLPCARSTVDR